MNPTVRPEDEVAILERTEQHIRQQRTLLMAGDLLRNLRLLLAMVRDSTFAMTWTTRSVILGALLYFLIPTDALPDVLPFVGYVDDGVVIGAVIRQLSSEIRRYREHLGFTSTSS